MNKKGTRPETLKKYLRAKHLIADGRSIVDACLSVGLSKVWFAKLRKKYPEGG